MIVTDITSAQFPPTRIVGLAGRAGHERRSASLHVSQIYQDLSETIGMVTNNFTEEELGWYRAGGFLWESVFSYAMAEEFRCGEIVRPGEFMVDGVVGSPDNWNLSTGRVIETKCTWRSSKKLEHLEKFFWSWLVQMKGYCRLLGTTEAELYVLFVNGSYAPPRPEGKALLLKWSQHEITENWSMLLNHARKRRWL